MKSAIRIVGVVVSCLSLVCGAAEDGFVDLLAGGTLDAWQNSGNYKLEDGVIHGTKGRLFTKAQYEDFHLKFEFKLADGSNNGLAVRTPPKAKPIELQIIDNPSKKYLKIKDYQRHGSLYNYVPAKTGFLKPTGQWNAQEVVCKGSMVTVTLNGTVIMEADFEKVKPIGDSYIVDYINKAKKGQFGFLGHNSPIWVRNISVKKLGE